MFPLHDGEGARQKQASDPNLGRVDSTQDGRRAHPLGDAPVTLVDETHDVARGRALGGHDGDLSSRVDKRVELVTVDFDGDVEHCDATERYDP